MLPSLTVYQRSIVDAFVNESLDDSTAARRSETGDNMPLDDIMELWSKHTSDLGLDEPWNKPDEDSRFSDSEDENFPGPAGINDLPVEKDEAFDVVMPELKTYRDCIVGSPAYEWLLSDLQKQCLITPSNPNLMSEVSKAIMRALPAQPHFRRREPVLPYKMTYTVDWDLVSFLEDQEYSIGNSQALPLVVTVTGSREAAQALTCTQYLHQTWPSSGESVLKLFQTLLRSVKGDKVMGMLSDTIPGVTFVSLTISLQLIYQMVQGWSLGYFPPTTRRTARSQLKL
jgi:hypothetical protein